MKQPAATKRTTMDLSIPEKESLSMQVANELRHSIADGRIAPGTHIREAELAEMLNISRAPVREAINLLVSEQLLERQPYKGVTVFMPDESSQKEIFDARILIECYAIEKMVSSGGVDGLVRCQSVITRIKHALKNSKQDWKYLLDLDIDFHRAICESCGNRILLSAWESMMIKQRSIFLLDNADNVRNRISANEHIAVFEAIEAGDVAGAQRLITDHIMSTTFLYSDGGKKQPK